MTCGDSRRRGFTLIELLSSMVVGSLILLAAGTFLASTGEGYERVGGGVATEREARALLTQLAADLSTARFHKDGVFETSAKSWPTDRLGFLCLQPAQAQTEAKRIGDLCAVNYHIDDINIGGKTVRCLMRGFRESADTFTALENNAVAGLFAPQTATDEPVAFGVVSFEARPKSRDAAGMWIDWAKNDLQGPQALDVRLVIARRELAGRLKQADDWDDAANRLGPPSEAGRNPNLEVYATRLRFGNHESP